MLYSGRGTLGGCGNPAWLSHSVWHSSVKNNAEEPPNKMQLVSVNAGVGIPEDGTSIQVERGGILGDIVVSRAGM